MTSNVEATDQVPLVTCVQEFFDQPRNYLDRRKYEIRVRTETTEALLKGLTIRSILDVGCGDGSISLPLLSPQRRLTLLDISPNMLSLVRSRVPESLSANVELVNTDFLTAPLASGFYDVVICIGVLAHVRSPRDVISRIATLLRPGGLLILQCTDSSHFVRRLYGYCSRIVRLVRPPVYRLASQLTNSDVLELTAKHRFRPTAAFCYSCAPPGSHRVISQETLYHILRTIFGDVGHNRSLWLANEYIYALERY